MRGSEGRLGAAAAAILVLIGAQHVAAQGPPILPTTRIVQAGPVSFYPVFSLRNVGIDSNVYNSGSAPREDFTYSLFPRLYAVVPIGRTRFIGTGIGDFLYYRTYKDQQALSAFFEGRYDVLNAPVRPFATVSFASRRERLGLEIDARARQSQSTITLGSEFELSPITSLTGWVRRENTAWSRDEQYLGVFLAEELNRSEDVLAGGARFRVTPFTRIIVEAEIERDRFERSPSRDADSLRIAPTVEFENGGAITGQARAGYRSFRPLNPALAGYSGFTASAGIRYSFLESTRVNFDGGRDVRHSYETLQPYYLESGVRFKVTQQIAGPFEVIGMAERWQLRYQRVGGTAFDGRQENTRTLGGGVGFLVNPEIEITMTVDRTERRSSEPNGRNYDRHRVLASVSYGL